MLRVFATIEQVAPSIVPVLILGETGTGKEIVARTLHERSMRSGRAFHCVNCGGLPESLVEATLFGHERGAFTGATERKMGVFEAADGGTVFLDEVGELPSAAQASLLRVLETKRITRVGGVGEIPVDVRIVSATHRDLESMSSTGRFRWDLYYRLNVISISIPALRFRVEDITPLSEHFLLSAAEANERQVKGISAAAIEQLKRYNWPGNVRELKNVVERAVIISNGEWVELGDLPPYLQSAELSRLSSQETDVSCQMMRVENLRDSGTDASGEVTEDLGHEGPVMDYKTQMLHAERRVLLAALQQAALNQTEAAKLLQMPLRTLVHKITTLGLRDELSRLKAERRRT